MYGTSLVNETISCAFGLGYNELALVFISLLSVISGILVIISKNPVVSVLFLISLFLCIACYLLVLGLNFIGLSYLLVYVGAVSILFLFILMLINVRVSELLSDSSNSIPLAIVVSVSFNFSVSQILPFNLLDYDNYTLNSSYLHQLASFFNIFSSSDKILFVTSKLWDGNLAESTHIASIGNIMYTSYCIWLIITSIILLLAMVGAIVITIK